MFAPVVEQCGGKQLSSVSFKSEHCAVLRLVFTFLIVQTVIT